jgi:hypothetical protein
MKLTKSITGMALILAAASAHATIASETFNLGVLSAGSIPGGTPPWVTAVLSETVTPGTLNLTLTAPGLLASEYMSGFYMNYSPAAGSSSLAGLTFSVVGGSGVTMNGAAPFLHGSENLVPLLGYTPYFGKFDIGINFNLGAGGLANRFQNGDTITIAIGNAQLGDFNYFSQNSGGDTVHMVGAAIRGINVSPDDVSGGRITANGYIPSGIIPVPEASTWFAGAGALGLLIVGAGARSRKSAALRVG